MKTWLLVILSVLSLLRPCEAAEFISLDQVMINQQLVITPHFDLGISKQVEDAINSGIVITFVIQATMKDQRDWWLDSTVSSKVMTFKLRYFSLSRQYQLHNLQLKQKFNFVTIEQMLDHLANNTRFEFSAGEVGDYIETRIFLDKQALPSTMQLPIVFDQDWNIQSHWQEITVNVQLNAGDL